MGCDTGEAQRGGFYQLWYLITVLIYVFSVCHHELEAIELRDAPTLSYFSSVLLLLAALLRVGALPIDFGQTWGTDVEICQVFILLHAATLVEWSTCSGARFHRDGSGDPLADRLLFVGVAVAMGVY